MSSQVPLYIEDFPHYLGELLSANGEFNRKTPVPFYVRLGDGMYKAEKRVGAGSFATVWKVLSMTSGEHYAMRVEAIPASNPSAIGVDRTVDLVVRMGMYGIGAKSIFAALVRPTARGKAATLIMLMELGDPIPMGLTAREALRIVASVERLVTRMISQRIYCVDIKPGNSLILHGKVRLIDFDYTFCTEANAGSREELTPKEQRGVVQILTTQYALMLERHVLRDQQDQYMQEFLAGPTLPPTAAGLRILYSTIVLIDTLPRLRSMLQHYNPTIFADAASFADEIGEMRAATATRAATQGLGSARSGELV